jgi:hypothetical protein
MGRQVTERRKPTRRADEPVDVDSLSREGRAVALRRRLGVLVTLFDPPRPTKLDPAIKKASVRRPVLGPAEVPTLESFGRDHATAFSDALSELLKRDAGPSRVPADSSYWLDSLLLSIGDALADAAGDLVEVGDLSAASTNTLSLIGELLSRRVRQWILLSELQRTEWNLAHTAERLRLGYGTANVMRAIKDLDLLPDYEAARAAGMIKRGGRRPRVNPPKKLPK